MTWGIETDVRDRFAAAGIPAERVNFSKETFVFNYDGSPTSLVAEFRDYYGPVMNAFAAAAKDGKEKVLLVELETLFSAQNRSRDLKRTSIPATYLRVVVGV